MPTYQYACTACGHRFEAVQSFTDASLSECPECSGKLRKLFGSVGVVFKGSGFYRNDSRAEANSASTGAETKSGESKSTESKSGDGGSAAKPASTTSSSSTTGSSAGSGSSGSAGSAGSSGSSGKAAAAS